MSSQASQNSSASQTQLIEFSLELPQNPFMTRRKQTEAPNRKGELPMKSKLTLALAAAMFTLTLSAFPHHAVAGSTTAVVSGATSDLVRAGGDKVKYMAVGLAVDILLSALLP